jgi:hypothetical protein
MMSGSNHAQPMIRLLLAGAEWLKRVIASSAMYFPKLL